MKARLVASVVVGLLFLALGDASRGAENSEGSEACIGCHVSVTPSVVAEWAKSRHAMVSPAEALKKNGLERKVSSESIPEALSGHSVGCAECHTVNAENHKDTFEHQGYKVHIIVTPTDCAVCHSVEADQYSGNMMSHAYGNLVNNSLYRDLVQSVNGIQSVEGTQIVVRSSDEATEEDSCLSCHGTAVEVKGTVSRDTEMGPMDFPLLSGWPNQGVGRLNPDGSKGSCAACHARHQFPIEMARKPYTCSECHKGPDVPAYKVYSVSKHGNIYGSLEKEWDFKTVPWTVGKSFTAPTCAVCHISLIVSEEGRVVAERTHRMSNRIPWRIFGLVYAHPHPRSPDTTVIRNKADLPLPTDLDGGAAEAFLIDAKEQENRRTTMQAVCLACHGSSWVSGHWSRFENTIKTTNELTLTATRILTGAWEKGLAKGMGQGDSIFNEPIEKMWVEHWMFFANSTRFSSAMCGADYGAFEDGRWSLSKNIREMDEWVRLHQSLHK